MSSYGQELEVTMQVSVTVELEHNRQAKLELNPRAAGQQVLIRWAFLGLSHFSRRKVEHGPKNSTSTFDDLNTLRLTGIIFTARNSIKFGTTETLAHLSWHLNTCWLHEGLRQNPRAALNSKHDSHRTRIFSNLIR